MLALLSSAVAVVGDQGVRTPGWDDASVMLRYGPLIDPARFAPKGRLPEATEEIEGKFSRTDLQVGFAGLLRQCDSTKERASFHGVRSILTQKADGVHDDMREMRLAHLKAWRDAAKTLRLKSLNQLIRDKLVADEGLQAFAYNEEHSPEYLLSLYSCGDLIHWDSDKSAFVAEFERDPYIESDRRLAYLDAASGLAHLYIGFAEFARGAVGGTRPKRSQGPAS